MITETDITVELCLGLELHRPAVFAVHEHFIVNKQFVPLQLNAGLGVLPSDLSNLIRVGFKGKSLPP